MSRQNITNINKIIKMEIVPKSEKPVASTHWIYSGHIIQLKVNICYAMLCILCSVLFQFTLVLCIK